MALCRSFLCLSCLSVTAVVHVDPSTPSELDLPCTENHSIFPYIEKIEAEQDAGSETADIQCGRTHFASHQGDNTELEKPLDFVRNKGHSVANYVPVPSPGKQESLVSEKQLVHRQVAAWQLKRSTRSDGGLAAHLTCRLASYSRDPAALSCSLRHTRSDKQRAAGYMQREERQRGRETKQILTNYLTFGRGSPSANLKSKFQKVRLGCLKRLELALKRKLGNQVHQRTVSSAGKPRALEPQPLLTNASPRAPRGHAESSPQGAYNTTGERLPLPNTSPENHSQTKIPPTVGSTRLGSPREDDEGSPSSEELMKLLQWRKRQAVSKQLAARREARHDEDEDPPPDPTEQRILSWMSESTAADNAIDFGHGLSLTSKEKEALNSRVQQELAKVPRAPHFIPSEEGLLFLETFERPDVFATWVTSANRTHPGYWEHVTRTPEAILGDRGLMASSRGLRHAISRLLPPGALPSPKRPLVLQYELQQLHPDFGCGGGYLTFFAADGPEALYRLGEGTPYALVFGADQCGFRREIILKTNRVCPLTGDRDRTRLLTLILKPEGSYKILLDGRIARKGTLFEGLRPPWPNQRVEEVPEDILRFNAVGLMFMAMDSGTLVDNIVISNDIRAAQKFARETFWKRTQIEHEMAESALRTRSALRMEIRARRREIDFLSAFSGASIPEHYSAEIVTADELPQQTKMQNAQRFPKAGDTLLTAEDRSQITTTTPSDEYLQMGTKHGKAERRDLPKHCNVPFWLADADASVDAILNGLIILSLLATV